MVVKVMKMKMKVKMKVVDDGDDVSPVLDQRPEVFFTFLQRLVAALNLGQHRVVIILDVDAVNREDDIPHTHTRLHGR